MTDRPRFIVMCDGTDSKPHKPGLVALYTRDTDGTWLPIHSAIRDGGKQLVLPDSGYRPESGQFDWPCPNRRCGYRFRASTDRVAQILDRFLDAGQTEESLRRIEHKLRHTD